MDRRRKAYLAWQLGAGRGHVTKLRLVAGELDRAGWAVKTGLSHPEFAHEMRWASDGHDLLPRMGFRSKRRRELGGGAVVNFTEMLGDLGFDEPELLSEHVGAWKQAISAFAPDVVVAEFSPCAILAARVLGVPVVAMGVVFFLPDAHATSFPNFADPNGKALYQPEQLLDTVNRVLAQHGGKPIERLPQVFEADIAAPSGIALCDPYRDAPGRSRYAVDVQIDGPASSGPRDEVFAYLSLQDRADPDLLSALIKCDLPVRLFMPGVNEKLSDYLHEQGVKVEAMPITHKQIARRSRMMVNAANGGTLALGVRAGLPQVNIPRQNEQFYNAMQLAETGAGRPVTPGKLSDVDYAELFREVYFSEQMQAAALKLADDQAPEFETPGLDQLGKQIAGSF